MADTISQSEADQEARTMSIIDYYSNEEHLREAAEKRKKFERIIEAMSDVDDDGNNY